MLLARIMIWGVVLRTSKCDADGKVPRWLSIELHSEQVSRLVRQLKDHVSHAQGGFSYLWGAMPNRASSVHSQRTLPTYAA